MNLLMTVVSGLCVVAGAVLLAFAVVVLTRPRWYRRRWGKAPSGRLASINSAPFTVSQGRKRSGLYFWAGPGAPYDDLVADPALGEAASEAWLDEQERLRKGTS